MKVASTLENAFKAHHEIQGATPEDLILTVNSLTKKVVDSAREFAKTKGQLHVHNIQDMIENHLMQEGFFDVAKEYILTRARLGQQTVKPPKEQESEKQLLPKRKFKVKQKDESEK